LNNRSTSCIGLMLGLALATGSARADEAATYAAPTEIIKVGKASGGKFGEASLSAGGYSFFAFEYAVSDGIQVKIFGAGKEKMKNVTKYRFVRSDGTPVLSGKCLIRTEEKASIFGIYSASKNSGLYKCDFADLPESDYALEVVVPQFASAQIGIMTIEKDDPNRWEVVKARLRYKGVTYEAAPTGIDKRREAFHLQPIMGYAIGREGKPLGRVDFDFTGVQSSFAPKGAITAPTAEADGREAVIFFAAQLLAMPDMYKQSNAF